MLFWGLESEIRVLAQGGSGEGSLSGLQAGDQLSHRQKKKKTKSPGPLLKRVSTHGEAPFFCLHLALITLISRHHHAAR